MRYILPCAGLASRWEADTPKHLVCVDGELLLKRTVRQIRTLDSSAEIVVVVRDLDDKRYRIDETLRYEAALLEPRRAQADKLLSSAHLWDTAGRNAVLWGDVVWSDEALERVVASSSPWSALCRFTGSRYSGKEYGEFFGFVFDADEAERLIDAARFCATLDAAGELKDWSGGWQIFAAAAGADRALVCGQDVLVELRERFGTDAIEIDDWTDDFDTIEDVERWLNAWNAHRGEAL